jgi:succinate-acetate transporter protein
MATEAEVKSATQTAVRPAMADPAPLGLCGFATTTLILSAANAGITGVTPFGALSLALFFGGTAQLLAGMWEFKNGNTFGATAFSGYGAFWLSFWAFFNLPAFSQGKFLGSLGTYDLGWYLLAWTIFTFILMLGTLKLNNGLLVVFVLLFITFLLLTLGEFAGSTGLHQAGGYVGIATAIAAFYMALAGITKAVGGPFGVPVGPRS